MEACSWIEVGIPDQKCYYRAHMLDVDADKVRVRYESLPGHDATDEDTEWVSPERVRHDPPPRPEAWAPLEVRRAGSLR